MSIIPDVPPKLFSLSAVAVGYILIDDLTANEQNALSNWLMLVAQVLSTNAFYKQVQTERENKDPNNSNTIEMMEKMINALNQELENIKNNL